MRRKIAQKLRSRGGESIAETLIALLISSLALVMLAGAVSSATSVVLQSKTTMTDYYKKDSGIVKRDGTAATVNMLLKDTSADAPLAEQTISVDYYKNDTFSSKPVYAYTVHKETTTDP